MAEATVRKALMHALIDVRVISDLPRKEGADAAA
jgi:hypothetical protein